VWAQHKHFADPDSGGGASWRGDMAAGVASLAQIF